MRKKRSLFNIIGSLGSYFISTIFTFITQMFLIKILGVEYSGVNGLFSNILTMLSIAELGIGTTIIYKLYEPIANNDIESIKSWMHFYKICYRIVAVLVFAVGTLIIPIVPHIVGKVSIDDDIRLLYFMSLLDTVFSYTMTYKRSLIYADQKNYIINIVHIGYTLFMNVTQIIALIILKNYVIFLFIKIVYRFLENIILNIYANKNYPYINEEYIKLSKNEIKDVFDRVKAMFLQKISYVVNKGIDSIIITMNLGIINAGYYSNYTIIVNALTAIIFQVVSSLTASVGNLLTEKNKDKSYQIYKKINMFDSFLTGIGICGFLAIISDFIRIWIGKEYVLNVYITISFAIYIYSDSIRRTMTLFKDSAGICKEDKNTYVVMTLINLITSIVLCQKIGMSGVILGTAIGYIYLIIYSYPKYIFKPLFNKQPKFYYLENFIYFIFIFISGLISFIISNYILVNNLIFAIIIKGILSIVIYCVIFVIMFYNAPEFKYFFNLFKKIILKEKSMVNSRTSDKKLDGNANLDVTSVPSNEEIPVLPSNSINEKDPILPKEDIIPKKEIYTDRESLSNAIRNDNSYIRNIDFNYHYNFDIIDLILEEIKIYNYKFNNEDYLRNGKYPIILSNNHSFMKYVIDKDFNNIFYIDSSNMDKSEINGIINYTFKKVYALKEKDKNITFNCDKFKDSNMMSNSYFIECLKYIK